MNLLKPLFLLVFCLIALQTTAAEVDTVYVESKTMQITYKAAVIKPSSYAQNNKKYPVVYLLHGAMGHFNTWLNKIPNKSFLTNLADQYNTLIVMPEGEIYSWYIDSPFDKKSQFETHVSKEVVEKIDALYRTVKGNTGRAITGYSMGGHGALYLSARHPDLYACAGSISGGVDMNYTKFKITGDFSGTKREFERILGTSNPDSEIFKNNSIVNMLELLKKNALPISIDCGVDDYLIDVNRALHEKMVAQKIPHDYTERSGGHTWDYWENALTYQFVFFDKIFKKNGAKQG